MHAERAFDYRGEIISGNTFVLKKYVPARTLNPHYAPSIKGYIHPHAGGSLIKATILPTPFIVAIYILLLISLFSCIVWLFHLVQAREFNTFMLLTPIFLTLYGIALYRHYTQSKKFLQMVFVLPPGLNKR
jgi:hypothetical protein